jgi:ribosomal protein S15
MWARVAKRFVASGGVGGGGTGTEVSSSRYAAGVRGFLQAGAWRAVSSVSAAHRAAGSDGSAAASSSRLSPQGVAKDGDGDIKPDLVRKYLSSEQFSKEENNRLKLLQVRTEFSRHSADCGSTEVQIAALTTRIMYMTEHLKIHKKDKSSRRGLIQMLEDRKKLLKYLRSNNGDRYGDVIYRLGLKDRSFVEDKYKTLK